MSAIALKHLKYLATEIGPRGSCTEAERRGHAYCKEVLEALGYQVRWETFRSPRSGWLPNALAFGLVLLAEFLSFTPKPWGSIAAALIVLFSLASLLLLITHRWSPLNLLVPNGQSQNVWARVEPANILKWTYIVAAHVDSHRTVCAMRDKRTFKLFRVLGQVTGIAMAGLLVIFIVSVFKPSDNLTLVSMILSAVVAISLVVALWPEFTKFVAGANDNASGTAAVLEFAARLKKDPLKHSAVCLLLTGCEEVGGMGAKAFVAAHPELADAEYLVVDGISGPDTKPSYMIDETLLFPVKSNPALLEVARQVAYENGSYGAGPAHFKGMTDMSPIATAGKRAISFANFRLDGMVPNWHQHSDTFDRVDDRALDNSLEYIWEVMRALDRRDQAPANRPDHS